MIDDIDLDHNKHIPLNCKFRWNSNERLLKNLNVLLDYPVHSIEMNLLNFITIFHDDNQHKFQLDTFYYCHLYNQNYLIHSISFPIQHL
jgi:hypothetical protein